MIAPRFGVLSQPRYVGTREAEIIQWTGNTMDETTLISLES